MSFPISASLAQTADASELKYLLKILYALPTNDITTRMDTMKRIIDLCLPLEAAQHTINHWSTILFQQGNPLDVDRMMPALHHALAGRLRLLADSLAPPTQVPTAIHSLGFAAPSFHDHHGSSNFHQSGMLNPDYLPVNQNFLVHPAHTPVSQSLITDSTRFRN